MVQQVACYLGFHDQDFNQEFIFIDNNDVVDTSQNFVAGEPSNRPNEGCGIVWIYRGTTLPNVMGDYECGTAGFTMPAICEGSPATVLCDSMYTDKTYINTYDDYNIHIYRTRLYSR